MPPKAKATRAGRATAACPVSVCVSRSYRRTVPTRPGRRAASQMAFAVMAIEKVSMVSASSSVSEISPVAGLIAHRWCGLAPHSRSSASVIGMPPPTSTSCPTSPVPASTRVSRVVSLAIHSPRSSPAKSTCPLSASSSTDVVPTTSPVTASRRRSVPRGSIAHTLPPAEATWQQTSGRVISFATRLDNGSTATSADCPAPIDSSAIQRVPSSAVMLVPFGPTTLVPDSAPLAGSTRESTPSSKCVTHSAPSATASAVAVPPLIEVRPVGASAATSGVGTTPPEVVRRMSRLAIRERLGRVGAACSSNPRRRAPGLPGTVGLSLLR